MECGRQFPDGAGVSARGAGHLVHRSTEDLADGVERCRGCAPEPNVWQQHHCGGVRLQEAQPCEEGARRARPVDGCDREDRSTPNPADQLRRASSPDHGVGGGPADQDVDSAPNEDPTVRAAQRDGDSSRPYDATPRVIQPKGTLPVKINLLSRTAV